MSSEVGSNPVRHSLIRAITGRCSSVLFYTSEFTLLVTE
jgi:hypothetical protein